MGSTRLPGKVFLPLMGKPMIQNVYERLLRCKKIDNIIVATTACEDDDAIAHHFLKQGVQVFRGSAEDPLERYYMTAKEYRLTHIVRAMADCPFLDPGLIDSLVDFYFTGDFSFCHLTGSFPSGLDTTLFSYETLKKAHKSAVKRSEREHITPFITNNPNLFKIGAYEPLDGLYHHRWVVDYPEDYKFAQAVYAALSKQKKDFRWKDVVNFLEKNPEIFAINHFIVRDQGYQNSLLND